MDTLRSSLLYSLVYTAQSSYPAVYFWAEEESKEGGGAGLCNAQSILHMQLPLGSMYVVHGVLSDCIIYTTVTCFSNRVCIQYIANRSSIRSCM